jgi:hypothetical protein
VGSVTGDPYYDLIRAVLQAGVGNPRYFTTPCSRLWASLAETSSRYLHMRQTEIREERGMPVVPYEELPVGWAGKWEWKTQDRCLCRTG